MEKNKVFYPFGTHGPNISEGILWSEVNVFLGRERWAKGGAGRGAEDREARAGVGRSGLYRLSHLQLAEGGGGSGQGFRNVASGRYRRLCLALAIQMGCRNGRWRLGKARQEEQREEHSLHSLWLRDFLSRVKNGGWVCVCVGGAAVDFGGIFMKTGQGGRYRARRNRNVPVFLCSKDVWTCVYAAEW